MWPFFPPTPPQPAKPAVVSERLTAAVHADAHGFDMSDVVVLP